MKQYSQEEKLKKYDLLPDELKEALFSPATAKDIGNILTANSDAANYAKDIVLLVGYVLMGLLDYKDFAKELVEISKIDEMLAQMIFKEVDREIFLPLRDLLRVAHERGDVVEIEKNEKENIQKIIEDSKIEIKPKEISSEFKPRIFPQSLKRPISEIRKQEFVPGMIFGQDTEVKPILETSKPISVSNISFEQAGEKKNKIISELETNKLKEIKKPTQSIDSAGSKFSFGAIGMGRASNGVKNIVNTAKDNFNKIITNIKKPIDVTPEKIDSKQPTKIVNFSAPLEEPVVAQGYGKAKPKVAIGDKKEDIKNLESISQNKTDDTKIVNLRKLKF